MTIILTLASGRAPADSGGQLSTAVFLSDGSRFPGWTQWSDLDGGWIDAAKWVDGDFNADGKDDIAAIWNNGGTNTLTVSLSTGTGFTRSHWATNAGGWLDSTQWLGGDFNGDGKDDIAASWNNHGQLSTAVFLSDGSRFPGWTQWSDLDGGWIDAAKWVDGDFNADGKDDIAAIWNNGGTNTLTVSLSTGTGFTRSHWATNAGGWLDSTQWLGGDFNGDRKGDIAASWNNTSTAPVPAACQKAEEPYAGYVDKVPQTDADVVNAEHAVLYLVNVERAKRGLAALCYTGQLTTAARAHSENWASSPDRACPAHNPPLVCSHWDSRAGYAWPEDRFTKSGYGATATGENTQNGGGRSDGASVVPAGWTWGTPQAAVYWWMNHNPENNYANNGHRAAILNSAFKDAGPGAGRYTDKYGNHAATFTLMFGAR
ncbi:FG-GAP-like repeat-containing protein [Kitasatospora purpeofusca]|uniref:FG-GAP-like repeat-containing protein n=1 Tax=Kitasatospora purpeofusca TaxID=67352 RepID=UPI00324459BA